MMDIVELTHAAIASRQHLTIGKHSRLVQTLRVQTLRLSIHGTPPCPEGILRRGVSLPPPWFSMSAQSTLKDMAMGIHEAWQESHTGESISNSALWHTPGDGSNASIIGN